MKQAIAMSLQSSIQSQSSAKECQQQSLEQAVLRHPSIADQANNAQPTPQAPLIPLIRHRRLDPNENATQLRSTRTAAIDDVSLQRSAGYVAGYGHTYSSPEQSDLEPEIFESDTSIQATNPANLTPIPASSIIPNRFQPRKRFDADSLNRLAESIRMYGILQPITVRLLPNHEPLKYEIICGERRFRAGILAGLDVFMCHVLCENDLQVAELSVIENLLRDDLNIFEQAEAFQLLISTFGLTQQQVADKVGMSQSAVANKLRLLRFTQKEQQEILENSLTERHARCLLRLEEPNVRLKFVQLIVKDQLNVSATEQLIEKYIKYTSTRHDAATNSPVCAKRPHINAGILRDVRVFSNSIEKAADILRNSGIVVETQCSEEAENYVYTIRVAKCSKPSAS